jgi:uncharacterized membrane protein
MTDLNPEQPINEPVPEVKRTFFGYLRTYFLTGLVISAPVLITFYMVFLVVGALDNLFRPFIPVAYRPETYLPFNIPGTGVVLALLLLTLVGWLTANFLGRGLVNFSDRLISKMPVVGSVYSALRQIFKAAVRQDSSSFSQVALIEYPRKGLYCIAFVTNDADKRVRDGAAGGDLVAVFLPTTPNPTSGFLLFVPREDMVILDMSVEEGARLVISAGLSDEEE